MRIASVGADLPDRSWGLTASHDWALDTAIDLLTGLRDRPDDLVDLPGPDGGQARYGDVREIRFKPREA